MKVVDLGSGKVVHNIKAPSVYGIAMFGNVAVCCGRADSGGYYVNFYDLGTSSFVLIK